MKKSLMLFVFLLSIPLTVFAQDMNNTSSANQTGMMGSGQGGMMSGMMGMKTMVASDNGSVVILAGNKLLKYDKDLNLVKEADVKIEQGCPMMGQQAQPQAGAGQQKDPHHPQQ